MAGFFIIFFFFSLLGTGRLLFSRPFAQEEKLRMLSLAAMFQVSYSALLRAPTNAS